MRLRYIVVVVLLTLAGLQVDCMHSQAWAQTAGCGSGASWYLLALASPIARTQFAVACNEHDDCYDSYGKTQVECDNAFHNRMLGICARDHNTWFGRPLKIACNGRADAYYAGVQKFGHDAYRESQQQAQARFKAQAQARAYASERRQTVVLKQLLHIVGLAGKCMTVRWSGVSSDNGATLHLWDCAEAWRAPNQLFSLMSNGEIRVLDNKCLDTYEGGTRNGTPLVIWECQGSVNQKFYLGGNKSIQNSDGKCIDVKNGNTANDAQLIIWDCHGQANQQWVFSP